jgi:CBS domain-containing protein
MRPITAADVMNPNVLMVQEDMTVEELASFLFENEISGAPVVDPTRRLVGVVSVTDLARSVAQGTDLAAAGRTPTSSSASGTTPSGAARSRSCASASALANALTRKPRCGCATS